MRQQLLSDRASSDARIARLIVKAARIDLQGCIARRFFARLPLGFPCGCINSMQRIGRPFDPAPIIGELA